MEDVKQQEPMLQPENESNNFSKKIVVIIVILFIFVFVIISALLIFGKSKKNVTESSNNTKIQNNNINNKNINTSLEVKEKLSLNALGLPNNLPIITTGGLDFYKILLEYKETNSPFMVGGKLAFRAIDEANNNWFYVMDGKEYGREYTQIQNGTDVGGRLAYEAIVRDVLREGALEQFIVYDGKEYGRQYKMATSPTDINGKLAYKASISDDPLDTFIVYDGKEYGKEYFLVSSPVSLNGKLTYSVLIEENGDELGFVISDGKELYKDRGYKGVADLKVIDGKLFFRALIKSKEYDADVGKYITANEYVTVYDGKEIPDAGDLGAVLDIIDGQLVRYKSEPVDTGIGTFGRTFFTYNGKEYVNREVTEEGLFAVLTNNPVKLNEKLAYHVTFGHPYSSGDIQYIIYDNKKIAEEYWFNDNLIDAGGRLAFEVKDGADDFILLEK